MTFEIVEGGGAAPPRARVSRFTRERFEAIEPAPEEWIVHGLLPARGLAFLVGPPGAGKSFIAIDILARIASGRPALERRTRQVGVAYLAAESANGMRKRIKAWRTVHGGPAPFHLIPQALDLRSEADVAGLAAALAEMAAELAAAGEPPLGVLAIDTVAAAMPGGNENDGADMSDLIARVQRLGQALDILILLVAHLGKDEGRGIRGWSGQTGAADLILTVQRDKQEPELRILTAAKVKDGEDGARFAFRLAPVALGEDADGEPITSAAPLYEPAPDPGRPQRPPNAAEALVLKAVKLVAAHGPHYPAAAAPGGPPGALALARGDVKARAMTCGLSAPGEPANTASVRFSRALKGLAARGRIRAEGEWVWVV